MEKQVPPVYHASDAAFLNPPPSYEEVMGVYQTSLNPQQPDPPPLAYIDIMPKCLKTGNIKGKIPPTFDSFSAIIEGCNKWLKDNSGMVAWKCETIERKVDVAADGSLTYDLDAMIRHDATFGYMVYVRGIRMWLTKNPNPSSTSQQIGLLNWVPQAEENDIELTGIKEGEGGQKMIYTNAHMIRNARFGLMKAQWGMIDWTFKGLRETIEKLNTRLKETPVPGSILSVESNSIKASEGVFGGNQLDPEASVSTEDKMKLRRMTQIVRVYYVVGQPANEQIEMTDFVPEVTELPSVNKAPKFEYVSQTMQKLAHWIPRNQGVRIVNIQQYDAFVRKVGWENVSVASDSTDECLSFVGGDQKMVRTFRVFYVKSSGHGVPISPNHVTSRLFLPARTGKRSFENMNRTMERLDVWLRVTGLMVYSVETVQYLLQEARSDGVDTERSDYNIPATSQKFWITAIRVYFPSVYQEPDPSLLPLPPKMSEGGGSSSSCAIV